jgi:hypothetical protein
VNGTTRFAPRTPPKWNTYFGTDPKVIDSRVGSSYLRQYLLVPQDQLTFEWAQEKSLAMLKADQKHRVRLVRFCADRADCEMPDRPTHLGYDGIVKLAALVDASGPLPFGELISIGGDAVLRFRHGRGDYRQKVLHGRNPVIIQEKGITGRILHFEYWAPLVGDRPATGSDEFLDVFCQVEGALNQEFARAAFKAISALLANEILTVFFRTDGRFVLEDHYPLTSPFRDEPPLPPRSVYERGDHLYCHEEQGRIVCAGRSKE